MRELSIRPAVVAITPRPSNGQARENERSSQGTLGFQLLRRRFEHGFVFPRWFGNGEGMVGGIGNCGSCGK